MKRNYVLRQEIKNKTAFEAKTLKLYPDHLIDPVILSIDKTNIISNHYQHRFNMNMIVCKTGVPFGIYSRLIIAYFTHFEKFKYNDEILVEYRVARSTRELFKKITGGKITTEMQQAFSEQLCRVNNTYFSNKYTNKSNYFTKLIGHLEKRGREYYYTPIGIYADPLIKYTPIDIRVLQLCRLERQKFVPDLYIYLTKKLKYLKNEKIELDLHLMKDQILHIHANKSLAQFKNELKNALIFLEEIIPELKFKMENDLIILNKCILLPSK